MDIRRLCTGDLKGKGFHSHEDLYTLILCGFDGQEIDETHKNRIESVVEEVNQLPDEFKEVKLTLPISFKSKLVDALMEKIPNLSYTTELTDYYPYIIIDSKLVPVRNMKDDLDWDNIGVLNVPKSVLDMRD